MISYNDKFLKSMFSDAMEEYYLEQLEFPESRKTPLFRVGFKSEYPKKSEGLEIDNRIEKYIQTCEQRYNNSNYLYLMKLLMHDIIYEDGSKLVVDFNHYFDWIGLTNKVEEESLIEVFRGVLGNNIDTPSKYLMNLEHDNRSLNRIVKAEKSEQHMHLNASSLNFSFNYFALMHNCSQQSDFRRLVTEFVKSKHGGKSKREQIKISDNFYKCLIIFKVIKRDLNKCENVENQSLDKLIKYLSSVDLEHKVSPKYLDELFKVTEPKSNTKPFTRIEDVLLFLDTERSFIRQMVNEYKHDKYKSQIVFLYIYFKNRVYHEFVCENKYDNFENFLDIQDEKNVFFEDDINLVNRYYESVFLLYQNENVTKVEYRLKPDKTFNKSYDFVKKINDIVKMQNKVSETSEIEIMPVFHFIKYNALDTCKHSKEHCYCLKYDEYKKQMYSYRLQSNTVYELVNTVEKIGIDAASDELHMPPELIAPIFRRFRSGTFSLIADKVKFTYHVGEVYVNLLTGIRRIDEVITYFNYKSGDRIGHGVALGVDVDKYYEGKDTIFQSKGEKLDDLVWMYRKLINNNYNDATNILKLKMKIDKILMEFNNIFEKRKIRFTVDTYYYSMVLRSDFLENQHYDEDINYTTLLRNKDKALYENYNLTTKDYKDAINNRAARQIAELYRSNSDFCSLYNEQTTANYNTPEMKNMIEEVQRLERLKLSQKDISVEVNISSNYYITHIDKYREHPLFKMMPVRNGKADVVQCSINTDDSAIFSTSISREYNIVAKTLLEEEYSNTEVFEYIEKLIKVSNRTCWIGE